MSELAIYMTFTFLGFCLVWFFPRHPPFKPQALVNDVNSALASVGTMETNVEKLASNDEAIAARLAALESAVALLRTRNVEISDWQGSLRIYNSDEIYSIAKNAMSSMANDFNLKIDAIGQKVSKIQNEADNLTAQLGQKVDRIESDNGGSDSLAEQVQILRAELGSLRSSRRGSI